MSIINIKQLKPQIFKLKIKHPVTGETEFSLSDNDKEKVSLEIHIVGRNSKQWLDFMKTLKLSSNDTKEEIFSRVTETAREFVSSLIVGWTNNGALSEEYSAEAALKLISDGDNVWILEQIQEAIINDANFFLTSSED
jgi:hypothetical protein